MHERVVARGEHERRAARGRCGAAKTGRRRDLPKGIAPGRRRAFVDRAPCGEVGLARVHAPARQGMNCRFGTPSRACVPAQGGARKQRPCAGAQPLKRVVVAAQTRIDEHEPLDLQRKTLRPIDRHHRPERQSNDAIRRRIPACGEPCAHEIRGRGEADRGMLIRILAAAWQVRANDLTAQTARAQPLGQLCPMSRFAREAPQQDPGAHARGLRYQCSTARVINTSRLAPHGSHRCDA